MESKKIVLFVIFFTLDFVNCSNGRRIRDGQTARKGQFPYIASYQYKNDHKCGCSIITKHFLLTAAHCITYIESLKNFNIRDLRVVAGIIDLNVTDRDRQVRAVTEQFVYPNYNPLTYDNDIGIIYVKNEFLFFRRPVSSIHYQAKPDNSQITIAGWGLTNTKKDNPYPILQYALGPRITNNKCQAYFNKSYPMPTVSKNMICMIGRSSYAAQCDGDSGGPMLQKIPRFNIPFQVGIISWSLITCLKFPKPSIGTLIYPYLNWIKFIINQREGGAGRCRKK